MIKAVAYYLADSTLRRQRHTVKALAKRKGMELVAEIKGPGFGELGHWSDLDDMLSCIEAEGVQAVLIPSSRAIALSVLDRAAAILALDARGIQVIAARDDHLTKPSDEAKAMHAVSLRYGLWELLHHARVRKAAQKAGQERWRQMAATRRANALQGAL